MKPIINLDDPVGKVVGKRRPSASSLDYAFGLQKTMNELVSMQIPRGVYRFRSHEEADAWLMDHMTRKRGS